jgi:hypothetical protein
VSAPKFNPQPFLHVVSLQAVAQAGAVHAQSKIAPYTATPAECVVSHARKQALSPETQRAKQALKALHSGSARHAFTAELQTPTPLVAAVQQSSQVGAVVTVPSMYPWIQSATAETRPL